MSKITIFLYPFFINPSKNHTSQKYIRRRCLAEIQRSLAAMMLNVVEIFKIIIFYNIMDIFQASITMKTGQCCKISENSKKIQHTF